MQITLLKSKIHRATVTQAELDYVGSVTIDSALLREAGIMEYEKAPEKRTQELYVSTERLPSVSALVTKSL